MSTPPPPAVSYGQIGPPRRRFVPRWLLGLGAVLLVAGLWKCGTVLWEARSLANAFVHDFHQKLNNGQFEEICGAADEDFARSGTREDLVKFFAMIHTKLGNVRKESLQTWRVNSTGQGSFVVADYNTTFDRGSGVETFTWSRTEHGIKLHGYHIQSDALVEK